MMNTYRIKIKPVSTFYFGGKKTFNPTNQEKTNYMVESLKTPQQTTILGMLRYALLKGQIKVDSNKKDKELIGESSFNLENKVGYGIIKKISPVYFAKDEVLYREIGLNCQIKKDEKGNEVELVLLSLKNKSGTMVTSRCVDKIYYYSNYNPKEPIYHLLCPNGSKDPTVEYIKYDDILKPCQQPGNRKQDPGKKNEDGFYVQTKYRMEKDWSFCIFLQTDTKLFDGCFIASLGGDQSLFNVSVEGVEECKMPTLPEAEHKEGVVILISDAYIEDLTDAYFYNMEMTDFAYLRTKLDETKNYASLNRDSTKDNNLIIPQRSEQIRLAAKGSVFYCNDVKAFVQKLNKTAYQAIGYNHYIID